MASIDWSPVDAKHVADYPATVVMRAQALLVLFITALTCVYLYSEAVLPELWDLASRSLDVEAVENVLKSPSGPGSTKFHSSRTFQCLVEVIASNSALAEKVAAPVYTALIKRKRPNPVWSCEPRSSSVITLVEEKELIPSGITTRAYNAITTLNPKGLPIEVRKIASGDRDGVLRITLYVVVNTNSTGNLVNASVGCVAQRHSSLDVGVQCALDSGRTADVGKALGDAIKVQPFSLEPRRRLAALADVARNHVPTARLIPGLARELLLDLVGPETADEFEASIRGVLPVLRQRSLPTGELNRRSLKSNEVLDDEAAKAILSDPSWTVELLLPPEQLIAIHLPLFLPLAVSLIGSSRVIVKALLKLRRGWAPSDAA